MEPPEGFPWKTMNKGAQKALTNMRQFYGHEEGTRIFLEKAEEQGVGKTLRLRVNNVYGTRRR